jgi:hypothetical protein
MVSYTFNFMTHRELVIVSREFHLRETHFSFFLKTLAHYQKHLCGSLLNANNTLIKLSLTPGLRLSAAVYSKGYSKVLEYEYRVKTAALVTRKRYSIISLTLYLE